VTHIRLHLPEFVRKEPKGLLLPPLPSILVLVKETRSPLAEKFYTAVPKKRQLSALHGALFKTGCQGKN
jgi:hypothetical protein